jgi:hypothetical protein
MVVQARPDLLFGVIGHLLTFSELTSLVNSAGGWQSGGSGARISASFQEKWKMPTGAIWLKKAGGPPGDYEVGIRTTRIDVRCYGPHGSAADDLWAMLDAVLVPATGERQVSFNLNGVTVIDIRPEADAISDREPQTLYPVVWAPYLVTWR